MEASNAYMSSSEESNITSKRKDGTKSTINKENSNDSGEAA
jgi:hypothetical protein